MKIKCAVITQPIRDLAKSLKESDAYMCNAVSTWQTENNSSRVPSMEEMKAFIADKEREKQDLYLAIPNYKTEPFSANKPLASTSASNEITLRLLPENNPKEHFFNYITGNLNSESAKQKKAVFEALEKEGYTLEELKKILPTNKSIYSFLLWHEMSHIQNTDRETYWKNGKDLLTEDKIAIEIRATKEAWDKARKAYKMNPVRATESSNSSSNIEEDLTAIQAQVPNTPVDLSKLKKLEDTEEAAVSEEDSVEDLPEIGVEPVFLNKENERIKCAREFDSKERQDRIEMIARDMWESIKEAKEELIQNYTQALNEESDKETPDKAEINRLKEKIKAFNNDDYKAIVDALTPTELFDRVKTKYEEWAKEEGLPVDMVAKINKVLNNWDVLVSDACPIFKKYTDVTIVPMKVDYNNGNNSKKKISGTTDNSAEEQQSSDSNQDDSEGENIKGDSGWGYQVRYTHPHETLSKGVKSFLMTIPKTDKNGKKERDDLGNTKYLDEEYVHAVLVAELADMISPDDFSVEKEEKADGTKVYAFPALEKLKSKYPWVSQIILKLQTNPRLISAMYSDLRQDFIPMWKYYYDDKESKIKVLRLNQKINWEKSLQRITDAYIKGEKLSEDSLYNEQGVPIKENAEKSRQLIKEIETLSQEFFRIAADASEKKEYINTVSSKLLKACHMASVDIDPYQVKQLIEEDIIATAEGSNTQSSFRSLLGSLRGINSLIIKNRDLENMNLVDSAGGYYTNIAKTIGTVQELDRMSSFREGDKQRCSYSAPSYINTLIKQLSNTNLEERIKSIEDKFGRDPWFRNQTTGKWYNEWLRLLTSSDPNDLEIVEHLEQQELIDINGTNYKNWTPAQIKEAFIMNFFNGDTSKDSGNEYGWFNFPIFADSPVAQFIKFKTFSKNECIDLLANVVEQELNRIQRVEQRKNAGVSKIKNYDKNGLKFNFFPELNSYIADGGADFLEAVKILVDNDDLDGVRALCRKAVSDIMEDKFNTFLKENFSDDTKKFIAEQLANTYKYAYKKGAKLNDEEFNDALEHYFYNQAFATTQIIQLTTGDLAFYKDETDFQKRYKEVYAAGRKLNTNSKYGRKVEKTIYLKDTIKTSTSYDIIKNILDTAVEKGNIKPFDRDNILYKFRNVNAVDAQAFRSISSYRALLDMAGLWTDEMQKALDKFEGNSAQSWDISDFDVVWQTIKPFVYSMTEHPDGLGGTMLVPNQNKNSEFLLLATLNMIATTMEHSSYFRALNKFMEDNEIDVIQYESAVKAGAQDTVDLSYSKPKLEKWNREHPEEVKRIERAVKASIKQDLVKDNLDEEELANKVDEKVSKLSDIEKFRIGNDYLLHEQKLSQSDYNKRMSDIEPSEDQIIGILNSKTKIQKSDVEDAKNGMYGWKEDAEGNRVPRGIGDFKATVVREIPYADYIIQQPTPEHLLDTTAVFGSQFRNLIIADLPEDFEINIRGKKYNKQETIKLYQSLVVENLLEDFEAVKDKFENIEKLQEALLDLVKSGSYGTDVIEALQLVEVTDPKTGKTTKEFNIPLDNPTTTLKIQQLVNSLIKNKIGKQSIKGGACILASSIGFTKELHIEYNKDKGIKGFQCYMPAYSKQFYEPFMVEKYDNDGKVYYELDINKMPKGLRQAVGYRIPTEDKYSMAPLIIKGFLPQQNGSAIMLPMELTQIAGSDFDVDKLFLMLPEFRVLDYNKKQARKDFANNNQIFKEAIKELSDTELGEDLLSQDTKDFDTWWEEHKEEYRFETPVVEKINYNVNKKPEEQKRASRNNMLIDLSLAILGHPDTAEKILNPGSFDNLKLISNATSIINDSNLVHKFAKKYGLFNNGKVNVEGVSKKLISLIESQDADTIEGFLKDNRKVRSQLTIDTFIYNHVQNMTGKKLVAIFANNTSMQAKYQNTSLHLSKHLNYKINGRTINSLHNITSESGERISKNCASFSNAAVDNVKDPVLAKLMQNEQVAYITGFMLRAGLSVNEIGLLFNQPIIKECIERSGNLENLEDFYIDWVKAHPFNSTIRDITNEDLTKAIITKSLNKIIDEENYEEELKHYEDVQGATANFILEIKDAATQMNNLTSISRADSPNGAIGHSIARAQNQVRKVELFKLKKEHGLLDISIEDDELVQKDYLKPSMSKDQMREKLLQHKVPMLQAFYSLGVDLGVQLTAPYFSQTSKYLNDLKEVLYGFSPKGIVSDDILTTFYSEAIEWALSKTKLFGDDGKRSYYEKRDYYLYQFPKEFADLLREKPDYMQLSIFKKMEVRDGVIRMQGTGSYSETTKEELMRDFDSLLYDENNPKAQELAVKLLCYSYYKEGFKFGPTSFGKYFSSIFLSNFPEINNAIRDIKNDSEDSNYFGDFLSQFYANHYSEKDLLPHRKLKNEFTGESMDIDTNKYRNNLLKKPWDMFVLKTPDGKNTLMIWDGKNANNENNTKRTYIPAIVFNEEQKGNRGVFYNGNSTVAKMSEVKTKPSLIEENKKINPTKKFNNLADYNDIDSKLQSLDERQLEQIDQLIAGDFEDSLKDVEEFLGKPASEISDTEKYNIEGGQDTLEQPLC